MCHRDECHRSADFIGERNHFQVHTGTGTNPFLPLRVNSQWNLSISSPLPDGSCLLTVVDTTTWSTRLRKLADAQPKTLLGVLDSLVSAAGAAPGCIRHGQQPGTALASPQFKSWLSRQDIVDEYSSFMRMVPHQLHDGHVLEVCAAIDAAGGLPAEWWSQASLDKLEHLMNVLKLGSLGIAASANDAVRFFSSELPICTELQAKWTAARAKARSDRKPQGAPPPAAAAAAAASWAMASTPSHPAAAARSVFARALAGGLAAAGGAGAAALDAVLPRGASSSAAGAVGGAGVAAAATASNGAAAVSQAATTAAAAAAASAAPSTGEAAAPSATSLLPAHVQTLMAFQIHCALNPLESSHPTRHSLWNLLVLTVDRDYDDHVVVIVDTGTWLTRVTRCIGPVGPMTEACLQEAAKKWGTTPKYLRGDASTGQARRHACPVAVGRSVVLLASANRQRSVCAARRGGCAGAAGRGWTDACSVVGAAVAQRPAGCAQLHRHQ